MTLNIAKDKKPRKHLISKKLNNFLGGCVGFAFSLTTGKYFYMYYKYWYSKIL